MRDDLNALVASCDDLFSLPEVCLKLRAALDDPACDFARVAAIVKTEPVLAARILRIVNSALFGFAARIDSIDRALMIMGTQQLNDLVMADTAVSRCRKLSFQGFDMTAFWRRSVDCAVTARLLALECNVLDGERYFLLGLLHDIGHLVLWCNDSAQMQAIFAEHDQRGESLITLERRKLGFDYAQVGAALLHTWHLPEASVAAIGRHPHPQVAKDYPLETAIVHIASVVAAGLDVAAIPAAVWEATGRDAAALDTILAARESAIEEACALILTPVAVTTRHCA